MRGQLYRPINRSNGSSYVETRKSRIASVS